MKTRSELEAQLTQLYFDLAREYRFAQNLSIQAQIAIIHSQLSALIKIEVLEIDE